MKAETAPSEHERLSPTGAPSLGVHLILELYDCNRDLLRDNTRLATGLEEAVRRTGATIIDSLFHSFSPGGLSGAVVIAESHVTLHTWPEHGYAAVDAFTCGEPDLARKIEEALVALFGAVHYKATYLPRGLPTG